MVDLHILRNTHPVGNGTAPAPLPPVWCDRTRAAELTAKAIEIRSFLIEK
jgi:hypothetical protein